MTEEVKVNYVDHMSIAVKDLSKAEEDFRNTFGWEVAGRYKDPDGTGEVAKFITLGILA